jgi:hypothetical protein
MNVIKNGGYEISGLYHKKGVVIIAWYAHDVNNIIGFLQGYIP